MGYMKGLDYPDFSTKVAEEPLPQSDDSDVDAPMDVEEKDQKNGKKAVSDENLFLVLLAKHALPFVRPVLNNSPA